MAESKFGFTEGEKVWWLKHEPSSWGAGGVNRRMAVEIVGFTDKRVSVRVLLKDHVTGRPQVVQRMFVTVDPARLRKERPR